MSYVDTSSGTILYKYDDDNNKFKILYNLGRIQNFDKNPMMTVVPSSWYSDDIKRLFATSIDANNNIAVAIVSLADGSITQNSYVKTKIYNNSQRSDYVPTCIAYETNILVFFPDSAYSSDWEFYYVKLTKDFSTQIYDLSVAGTPGANWYKSQYSPGVCFVKSTYTAPNANFVQLFFKCWGNDAWIISGSYKDGSFTEPRVLAGYNWAHWQNGYDKALTAVKPALCQAPPILVKLFHNKNWMAALDGTLSLGHVNLPGTHDSAAIYDPWFGWSPKRYWCNQILTLTEQLDAGVRAFDIRISVRVSSMGKFIINTCHGGVPPFQTFQSLRSAMNEFKDFIRNSEETLVIKFQIDDAIVASNERDSMLKAIKNIINPTDETYFIQKMVDPSNPSNKYWHIPTLKNRRRKILPLSSIKNTDNTAIDDNFGIPMNWPNNDNKKGNGSRGTFSIGTSGNSQTGYVQDVYESVDDPTKVKYITEVGDKNVDFKINFISARLGNDTWGDTKTLNADILNYFGNIQAANRPNLGWCFLDYCNNQYRFKTSSGTNQNFNANLINALILSNFSWTSPNHGSYWLEKFIQT